MKRFATLPLIAAILGLVLAICVWKISAHFAGPATAIAATGPHEEGAIATAVPMGSHMMMTPSRPEAPGDKAKADALLKSAKSLSEKYLDYRTALADGYHILLPDSKHTLTHFARTTSDTHFEAGGPPMLIYTRNPAIKDGDKGAYTFVGLMYVAPFNTPTSVLDAQVPLSYVQWHAHVKVCVPAQREGTDWEENNPTYGFDGSITTQAACTAAGGKFRANYGGWMVHVFPFEQTKERIWQTEMDMHNHGAPDGMGSMSGMTM